MTTISKLLVANRGEIASRIFGTCRLMGISTVAVYAEPDASLPFVSEADFGVGLGGSSATESYLVIDKILDAARRSGADSIHPGFGFLSENATFAQAVLDAGFTWVGPTPANIVAMGTKVEAKALAAAAGVPILPSAVANGDDPASWMLAANDVGFPILVKASSGGGGKGMRIVRAQSELVEAITSARREAASSFGDPTVFMERYLPAPRHIEIQVFGDTHGNVIHLHERECSIQRRHQKILEETPSVTLSEAMRERMCTAAVGLAKSIGYVGAGTVEFLYERSADGSESFYFLEMNTRLQVEHPVTECITGQDLVRWQIEVARGLPLPLVQAQIPRIGAAIEVRLYAEDPINDFMPTFGHLHAYEHANTPGIRYDDGIASGCEITTYFDPMIAKIVSHAPTRAEAASRLASALRGLKLHGPTTNRDYLAAIVSSNAFRSGDTTTAFVEQHAELLAGELSESDRFDHLVAATLVGSIQRRRCDMNWGFAPAGFRNVPSEPLRFAYESTAGIHAVSYTWHPFDQTKCHVEVDGRSTDARIVSRSSIDPHTDRITIESDGITSTHSVRVLTGRTWVNDARGQSTFVELSKFPAAAAGGGAHGPIAPVPGRVVAVHVAVGQRVAAGETLVVMEAMKMEHRIEAPHDGVVSELFCAVGDQVDAHQVLVTITAQTEVEAS
jgi:propionyl-CoA carboxylase alpha chain